MPIAGLVAVLDFSDVPENEFHDWYDFEHLPERLRIAGFLGGERWIGAANSRYSIGTYDLADLDVLRSAPYLAIAGANASPLSKRIMGMCRRIMRVEADQTLPGDQPAPAGAGGLLLSAMNVASEAEAEFNAWFDTEHIPALAAVPGTLAARRFRARDGSHRYLSLYHLATPDVQETAAWERAAQTPWAARLQPHFRDRLRLVCRRYQRRG